MKPKKRIGEHVSAREAFARFSLRFPLKLEVERLKVADNVLSTGFLHKTSRPTSIFEVLVAHEHDQKDPELKFDFQ